MKKAALLLFLSFIAFSGTLSAQLTGIQLIPGNYPTLAAAITDLNTQGVGPGGVFFIHTAGFPETAPAGGYQITTTTGSAANPIVFSGNGNIITASAGHAVGALTDAIFKIIGADYVGIQGYVMRENPANTTSTPTGSNNMTEWGVALLYASVTNGAQNNVIMSNTISLNRAYTNTFGVYSNTRHTATAIATANDITAVSGSNSNNSVLQNTISDVNMGIAFIGSNNGAFQDQGNVIGSPTMGNVITNWGGAGATSGYISNSGTSYGILMNHQVNYHVRGNTLSTTATPTVTMRGIFSTYTTTVPTIATTNRICQNTITISSAATSGTLHMIGVTNGNNVVTMVVDSNLIQNCAVTGAASSTALTGISLANPLFTANVRFNRILSNTSTATTGGFAGISVTSAMSSASTISDNRIGNTGVDAITFSAATSGAVQGIASTGTTPGVTVSNNYLHGIVFGATSSSVVDLITVSGAITTSAVISGNTFDNISLATTGAVTAINNSMVGSASSTATISSNSVTTGFSRTAASGAALVMISGTGASAAGATRTITNNTFPNVSTVGGSIITGLNETGGASSGAVRRTITSNTFSGWSGNTVAGIVLSNTGVSSAVTGNTISNITTGGGPFTGVQWNNTCSGAQTCFSNSITNVTSGNQVRGLFVQGIVTFSPLEIANNVIGALTSSGSTEGAIGMDMTSTGGVQIHNNTIYDLNSVGSGVGNTCGMRLELSTAGGSVYANKIYDVENINTSGGAKGIYIVNCNTVDINNNYVGDISAPNTAGHGATVGIDLASGTTVNMAYNTVYLNVNAVGSNVGSTAISASTSISLTMRNNIFLNLSTQTGIGTVSAYTRSSASTAFYSTASNRNSFYAGTPSPTHLIFRDGVNSDQLLSQYKARVGPTADNAAVSENPPFSSVNGNDPDYLHIPAATATLLESGGVTVPGVAVDWDGDTRPGPVGSVNGGALAPDIGADEFDGMLATCSGTPTAGTASTTSANPQCAGNTFALQLNGHSTGSAFTYQWREATISGGPYTNISGATAATYTTTALTSTMYYVCVVTCTISGLSATSTQVTCTVNPNPVITFSPSAPALCAGGAPVNVIASGANTYAWLPATGLSSSTINNPDASPAATTTYTVTGTDVNGCTATETITVTVHPLPLLNASANPDPLCAGSTVTLDATGADSYVWAPISASGNSVTDVPASSMTYTVTGTDVNGCTNTATVPVTVFTAPTVVASADFTTVCSGSPVELTGSGASTYEWNPGTISGSPVTVTPSGNTTYTVVGTDADGCTASDMITITVIASPTVTAVASPLTICAGEVVTLDGFGADTYLWMPGSLSGSTVTDTPLSTTTYTVTGTAVSGCTGTETVTVTVNPLPAVSASATPAAICEGETTSLSATGASTYLWMPGSSPGTPVTESPLTTTTYTVTGTDGNGCSNSATAVVTVNPLPTVAASATPSAVCAGETVTLDAAGADVYTWMPGSLTGASVNDAPASTTTYTVTGTDVNGCTGTANTTVTVNPAPAVSVSAPSTDVCEGGLMMLTAAGATTYTWMPGSLSGTSVVVSPLTTTTYTVTGDDGSGCTATATITLTVHPRPVVAITGANSFCQGGSTLLTASMGAAWQWFLNGTPISGATSQTYAANVAGIYNVMVALPSGCDDSSATSHVLIENTLPVVSFTANPSSPVCAGTSVTLSGTGATSYEWSGGVTDAVAFAAMTTDTYTVTGTDVNGCTNTATATVNVNALPTVNFIAAPSASVCAGNPVTLSGTGATSYTWTGGVTDGVAFTPASTLTYTVTGTDGNGCTNTNSVTVTVNTLPTVSFTASPSATVCAGTSVTLSGTGAGSYSWSGGITDAVAFTPASNQTYTVIGTDGNGCTGTATASVVVNAAPVVSFTALPSANVCAGSSVTLSGTGATSYVWSGGVTNSVAFTPSATQTYTVTGTDGNGCTATATANVTVNPNPAVGTSALPSATVCAGNSITLNGTGASAYTWSGGVTDGIPFVPPATGTYTVTGTDGNGCTGTSTILVTVDPLPAVGASASPSAAVCAGASVTLNGTGAVSYTWSGGVTNGVAFVSPSTASYVVTGTNGAGCTNTATITVTVNALPSVSFTASPSGPVCAGTPVTLSGTGATSYTWSGGITDAVPFAASTTQTYTVTGTDANGCTAQANATVTVNPAPSVTASASPSATVCAGSSLTLSGNGATTYTWSGGVTNGVAFTPVSTNTYTVTGTDGIGCTSTATILVTVNAQPSISSTATPSSAVCAGTSVVLNGSGGISYAWSGGVSNGVPFTASSTQTYTVTGTDANGCTNTATRTVTVNASPSVSTGVSPSSTVCAGTMVTLNGLGASSYTWTGGVTDGVPFSATATTTYTVTGTDMNGCTGTATATVNVNPAPNINCAQSPAGPRCAGTNVTLNGIGGVSYTWSGGITNGVAFVATATQTYTVTGTDFSGCTNTATITVTVNPLPAVSSTAAPATTVCSGTPVTLNGTGAATYTWSGGVNNGIPFTPVSTQTYTVTGTSSGGCTNTATTTITVNPRPAVASAVAPSPAVCAGSAVTLSGTGAVTYTWSGGVTDAVPFTPLATTTYTVTGTGPNGCTNTATTTVTVNPLPVVGTNATPAPMVCSGTSVTLNGTGAATYVWSGGVTDNVPFTAAATTSYTVTGTDVNGCTATATTTLTVNASPTVSFTASPGISICTGTQLTLDGTGAVTYTWSDTITDGIPFIPLATDTFTVTGTDGNGCVDSATVIITVNTHPVIGTAFAPNDTVCENAQLTLMGTGASTYVWSHGVTDDVPFAATTTTTYTVIGTDANGCSDTTTQDISVIPAPVVNIAGNSSFCTGGSSVLTASAGTSYQWYRNGTPISGATTSTYTATTVGVYNVWVTNVSGCGDSSSTGVVISITTPPVVAANATATTLCSGTSVTLTGSGAASYAWSGGVNNGIPFTPLTTLTYTVVGTASNGCTDSETITVTVNALPAVTTSATPAFSVCEGTEVTLNGNGASTYTWTGGVVDGVPFTPLITDTYTVTGTDANGCTNTTTATVTVNANPVVDLGPDSARCGTILLDAGNAGATYMWSTTEATQTITATASGVYSVEVTTTAGCSASDTVVLTISTQPVVVLGADDTLCAASITLDAMNVGGTYVWNDFSTNQTNVVTASGTYFVEVTMPGGCIAWDTISVVLHTPPAVTLTLPLDTACLNMGAVALSGESPAGGTWSGPAVSGSTFNPMIAGVGTFGIAYTFTDTNGCTGSVVDSLLVDACLSLEETATALLDFNAYPNPNSGDFNITLNGAAAATVMIYDAAGQLVKTERITEGEVLNVSLEASGMYMVTLVTDEGEQVVKRMVVNR